MSLRQLLSRHTRVPTILSSRTYIGLPDEVQMLKDMTRTFAEQELAPIASKIDKERIHINNCKFKEIELSTLKLRNHKIKLKSYHEF